MDKRNIKISTIRDLVYHKESRNSLTSVKRIEFDKANTSFFIEGFYKINDVKENSVSINACKIEYNFEVETCYLDDGDERYYDSPKEAKFNNELSIKMHSLNKDDVINIILKCVFNPSKHSYDSEIIEIKHIHTRYDLSKMRSEYYIKQQKEYEEKYKVKLEKEKKSKSYTLIYVLIVILTLILLLYWIWNNYFSDNPVNQFFLLVGTLGVIYLFAKK